MRFIVIDGLDAAGKDTHARLIKEKYEEKGEEVIIRSHPSRDNPFGGKAGKALLGEGNISRTQASLFFSLDVFNSILNYYGKFDTVIFVRYLCGVAYLPEPMMNGLYELFSSILPTSNYMFFLDVDPADAIKRIEERKDEQMFENRKDLEDIRERALSLVDDWHVIDTSQPIERAQRDIEQILDKMDEKT